MIPEDIVATVFNNPLLLAGLTVAILALVAWQRTLSYREYRTAHLLKCRVFALLDPVARRRGRPLVRTKAYSTDSPEFVAHVHANPRAVALALREHFDQHLIATAKRRETPDGKQWAHSQWVQFHDDNQQTEAYLFAEGGGTDVYAHYEASVTDPTGHVRGEQEDGDPTGAVRDVLDGLD